MKDETIIQTSPVGKRLKKLGTKSMRCLLFNGKEIQMHSCLTIGRARENDFVIEDSMVSRYHLEIQQIRGSYFIKDRCSRNGTYLNGKIVSPDKYIKLKHGDTIRLGTRIELTMI
jgi:pSer/pThr/pTyr-binding forkhead associated (FHA) protein